MAEIHSPDSLENQIKTSGKRRWLRPAIIALMVVVIATGIWLGPTFTTAYRHGFLEKSVPHNFEATQSQDLKLLHQALMSYSDSEGTFPSGSRWMDAIEKRIQTADLVAGQAEKKLHDPSLVTGEYGWAYNDALSGIYPGDVKDAAHTPLIFSSSDLQRNAHGQPYALLPHPPRSGGNVAISVSGQIMKMP